MALDKEQRSQVFTCLIQGLEYHIHRGLRRSCAFVLAKLTPMWDDGQFKQVFQCLIHTLKGDDPDRFLQAACVTALETLSSRLNQEQLTETLQVLLDRFKDKNMLIQKTCKKAFRALAVKADEIQWNFIFQCLTDGFQDKNGYSYQSSVDLLGEINTKLDKKIEATEVFKLLIGEFEKGNQPIRKIFAKAIGNLSPKLNEMQLNDAFDCLLSSLKNGDNSSIEAFEKIFTQLSETQIEEVFQELMVIFRNSADGNESNAICANALKELIARLNDKQLCSLTKQLLKRMETRPTRPVYNVLLAMTDDMWACVVKDMPQENKETSKQENCRIIDHISPRSKEEKRIDYDSAEILAFGLLLFNPRIRLDSSNDNGSLTALIHCYNKQAEWSIPKLQQIWDNFSKGGVPPPCLNKPEQVDINDSGNECQSTLLHATIDNRCWDGFRTCIKQGVDIDARYVTKNGLRSPFESVMGLYNSKNDKKENSELIDIAKWILKQRSIYPMKRIEYAIDYEKNQLTNEDGVIKDTDEKNYATILQRGAAFLLGTKQKDLQDTLIDSYDLYSEARKNVKAIILENSKQKRYDKGWDPLPFLTTRIFLLFEICVRLKRGKDLTELPMYMSSEEMISLLYKELQVQLTTYWDYITTGEFMGKCPGLGENWSCNVVDRLMELKPLSKNECCEISLVVGHKGHCIYLSLCKISDSIIVRVDNRWMKTVPSNTPHPRNEQRIQPYVVAYFPCNGKNIDRNKSWLKDYIKTATELKSANENDSMSHLYCSDKKINRLPPCEGDVSAIVNNWPYRPVQTDANNCYLRSHNVGYRIRTGDHIYEWLYDEERKSLIFKKANCTENNNEAMISHGSVLTGNTNRVMGGN
ncbi:hypothetical protein RFI_31820 [Reticulomyxa filosa]|uniref:Uncharacterized protein n=1 Tax=Reticulomyxa filosa TaxID=46433 RepID=X6LVC7_RETFI|nr:hypothetical protein RFI_31820 [Reticulomyxa filosa]|eukprot:ETO05574.1 hypothetical protein RFI_31820 [Reticulomyxa filosa]